MSTDEAELDCEAAFFAVVGWLASADELEEALQMSGRNPSAKSIKRHWKAADMDYTNFRTVCEAEPATDRKELMKAFRSIDKNGDGFLTSDELTKYFTTRGEKMSQSEVEELIATVDVNRDGRLDFDEFCDMLCSTSDECRKMARLRYERRGGSIKEKPAVAPRRGAKTREAAKDEDAKAGKSLSPRATPPGTPRREVSFNDGDARRDSKASLIVPDNDALFKCKLKSAVLLKKPPSSYTQKHYNGAFFYENKGIMGCVTKLTVEATASFTIAMSHRAVKSIAGPLRDMDMGLFIFSVKDGADSACMGHTADRLGDTSWAVTLELSPGEYWLVPLTSGSAFTSSTKLPEPPSLASGGELNKETKRLLRDIFNMFDSGDTEKLSRSELELFFQRFDASVDDFDDVTIPESGLSFEAFCEMFQSDMPAEGGGELTAVLEEFGINEEYKLTKVLPYTVSAYSDSRFTLKLHQLESLTRLCISAISQLAASHRIDKYDGSGQLYIYSTREQVFVVFKNTLKQRVFTELSTAGSEGVLSGRKKTTGTVGAGATLCLGHFLMAADTQSAVFRLADLKAGTA